MAQEKDQAVSAEDALPMQKTSPTAKIAAGVGAAVILALVGFALSGGEGSKEKAAQTVKGANATEGLSKAELEERQAHLKKTQAALIAAAADDAEDEEKAQAAAAPKPAANEPSTQAPAPRSASSAPKPAPKPANTKKSMDSLDSLGADIASALK